ncbi:MAG TPA: hypothetical protein V6C96_05075 [Vampirovibrionales bacterium]
MLISDEKELLFNDLYQYCKPEKYLDWLNGLKKKGYLNPENFSQINREGNKEGWWSPSRLFAFLEKIGKGVPEQNKNEILKLLTDLVNGYIKYTTQKPKEARNPWADETIIKILCNLPIEKTAVKHFEFIASQASLSQQLFYSISKDFELLTSKLLETNSQELLEELLQSIIFKYVEDQFHHKIPLIDKYILEEWLNKYQEKLIEKAHNEIIAICTSQITQLYTSKLSYHFDEPHSIRDSNEDEYTEEYLLLIVRMLRDCYEQKQPSKEEVKELLKNENLIFRRIGIHIVNKFYSDFQNLFWDSNVNWLNDDTDSEVEHLLEQNPNLSEEEQEKFISWVETINFDYLKKLEEDDRKLRKAIVEKHWLSLLKDQQNNFIDKVLERYPESIPKKRKFKRGVYTVDYQGIANHFEFANKLKNFQSGKEVLEFIRNFKVPKRDYIEKGIDIFHWPETLAEKFAEDVSKHPNKYINNLDEFLKEENFRSKTSTNTEDKELSQKTLLRKLIKGFRNALLEKDDLNQIISFIKELLETKILQDADHQLIRELAELLEQYFDFEEGKFIPTFEDLFLKLAERTEREDLNEILFGDTLTAYLNQKRGIVLHRLMKLSLQRTENKQNNWREGTKNYFTKCLTGKFEGNNNYDLWTCLGMWFHQLMEADKDWVERKLDLIFPKANDKLSLARWKASFEAFLFNRQNISQFKTIYKHGDLGRAIQLKDSKSHIPKALVVYILPFFLANTESTKDARQLIKLLIEKGNTELLSHFIWEISYHFDTFLKEASPEDKDKLLYKHWEMILCRVESEKKKDPNTKFNECTKHLRLWIKLVSKPDDDLYRVVEETLHPSGNEDSYYDANLVRQWHALIKKESEGKEERMKFIAKQWRYLVEQKIIFGFYLDLQKDIFNELIKLKDQKEITDFIQLSYKARLNVDLSQ